MCECVCVTLRTLWIVADAGALTNNVAIVQFLAAWSVQNLMPLVLYICFESYFLFPYPFAMIVQPTISKKIGTSPPICCVFSVFETWAT